MASLKPVSSGQKLRISASDYNAILETTRAFKSKQLAQESIANAYLQAGIVQVQNNSGADRDVLDILAINAPLILPTENLTRWRSAVTFDGIAPALTHPGRYVVLQEPIAAGRIGRAMVIGVTPALVDVSSTAHRFAEVASGVTSSLKSGKNGSARILWQESGTGVVRAIVMLTGEQAKTTAHTFIAHQVGHGFAVGDVIRPLGFTYTKAQADNTTNAQFCGVVSAVFGPDDFECTTSGLIDFGVGYTVAYLSTSTPGGIQSSQSRYGRPVMMGINGTFGPSIVLPYAEFDQDDSYSQTESTFNTSGSYTFPTPGAKYRIIAVGAGGGAGADGLSSLTRYVSATSGGTPTLAVNQRATGGGGGAGGTLILDIDTQGITSFSFSIGAGGTLGNDGGNTTVTINGITSTAFGGKKGGNAYVQTTAVNPGYGGAGGHAYAAPDARVSNVTQLRGGNGCGGYVTTTLDGSGYTYLPNGGLPAAAALGGYMTLDGHGMGNSASGMMASGGNGVVAVRRIRL